MGEHFLGLLDDFTLIGYYTEFFGGGGFFNQPTKTPPVGNFFDERLGFEKNSHVWIPVMFGSLSVKIVALTTLVRAMMLTSCYPELFSGTGLWLGLVLG